MDACRSTAAICLLAFVGLAAVMDVRTRRIPNTLTVSAALAALLLNLWCGCASGAMTWGAGLLTGLAAFLPFYLAGGFGAGDLKAMAAVGAFVGPKGALLAALATLGLGGIGALLVLAALRWQAMRARRGWQLTDARHQQFPYGLAIACGTALSLRWI